MTTSLIHIGDFHAAPGPRSVDRYTALDQIIAEGLALTNLGAWLWPGDLNHARMSIEDRNALSERLVRMAARAPVIICYGNHDLPGELDIFRRLKAAHRIYVFSVPHTFRLRLATDEWATVFVLPYPTKAGLTALGVVPGDVIDVASEALEFIFMNAAAELEAAKKDGDITFMIGHVNVAGSMSSVGQPNVGHEIEIGPKHLSRLGHIYKGLNHIHKAQAIHEAYYAGSVCRLNWGEVEEKRYLQAQTDGDVWFVKSWPLHVAPMWHVEGELKQDGFTWSVLAGPGGQTLEPPSTWQGAEVRVRYRFNQSEKAVLNHSFVSDPFHEAAVLQVEPIAVPDRDLRAPELAAARTIDEKVAIYIGQGGLGLALADKLHRLHQQDSATVLASVTKHIAAMTTEKAPVTP